MRRTQQKSASAAVHWPPTDHRGVINEGRAPPPPVDKRRVRAVRLIFICFWAYLCENYKITKQLSVVVICENNSYIIVVVEFRHPAIPVI